MGPYHHQGRRPPSGVGQEVESSNSTANKFLGATRRPWMLGGVPTKRRPAPISDENSAPASSLPLRTDATDRDNSQTEIIQPTSPVSTQSIAQNAESTHSTITVSQTSLAPLSPVTPSGTLPKSVQPSYNSLSLQQTPVATRGMPAICQGLDRTSVLPSPEPSTGSHTSPADGEQEENHPTGESLPPMPAPSQLPEERPLVPISAMPPVSPAEAPGTSSERPRLESSQANADHVSSSSPAMRTTEHIAQSSVAPPQGSSQTPPGAQDRASFWKIARVRLQLFLSKAGERGSLSETVELPRIHLLQEACRNEDMFYIALHQVYCLSSYAPSQLASLARCFGIVRNFGFDVMRQLLVDNQNLSGDFLKWCVYYPSPLLSMLENGDYRNALNQVRRSLELISQGWVSFEKVLHSRFYPPLVEELVVGFGIASPTLQSIVFTALVRRLFGPSNERLIGACQTLFEQNRSSHTRRFSVYQTAVPAEVVQRETEDLIRRYLALIHQYAMVAQQPSQHASPMQSPINDTPANTPPVTVGPHQQMRSGPTPNSALRSNSILSNTPTSSSISPQMAGLPSNPTPSNRPRPQQREFIQQYFLARPGAPLQALGPSSDPRFPQSNMHAAVAPDRHPMAPPHVANYPSTNNTNGRGRGITRGQPQYPQGTALGSGIPPGVFPSQQPVRGPSSHNFPPQMPPCRVPPSQQSGARPRPPRSQQMQPVPLLPPRGAVPAAAPLNPSVSAVHQVHLRTPPAKLVRPGPDGVEATDLVQYLLGFAIRPTPLEPEKCSFVWQFSISPEAYRKRPSLVMQNDGSPTRLLSDGVCLFRLRCVPFHDPSAIESLSYWSSNECKWPNAVYIDVNGKEMFVRRAFHHGKDLPVDITSCIKEGTNEISLNILRTAHEKSQSYAIAVEVIDIASLSRIKEMVQKLPAAESREQIRKRLSSHAGDEDLVVMDDYITVDLRDPFTTRVFDTPVRGRACTHWECFDLDTFLQTVVMTPKTVAKKAPYLKCPICRKGALPTFLAVDEFLVEVRAELERSQKLEHTRSIRVKADGSWEPILVKDTPQPSTGAESGSVVPAKRDHSAFADDLSQVAKTEIPEDNALSQISSAPEVIELD